MYQFLTGAAWFEYPNCGIFCFTIDNSILDRFGSPSYHWPAHVRNLHFYLCGGSGGEDDGSAIASSIINTRGIHADALVGDSKSAPEIRVIQCSLNDHLSFT